MKRHYLINESIINHLLETEGNDRKEISISNLSKGELEELEMQDLSFYEKYENKLEDLSNTLENLEKSGLSIDAVQMEYDEIERVENMLEHVSYSFKNLGFKTIEKIYNKAKEWYSNELWYSKHDEYLYTCVMAYYYVYHFDFIEEDIIEIDDGFSINVKDEVRNNYLSLIRYFKQINF